jgi:hypothetical protein
MAILHGPANAFWIGSDHPFDLHESYLNFRSPDAFYLASLPARAELFITADSRYRLWVNGQFVARGPARSWPHAQSVDQLDVTAHLHTGPNVIAVQVYQPGYSHFSYLHRGASGLLAWLVCDGAVALLTDTAWRVQRDRSFTAVVPRVSIYGTGVEDRDLARAEDWMDTGFVASGWAAPRIVAPIGGYPWRALCPRPVPLLVEHSFPLAEDSPQRRKGRKEGEGSFMLPRFRLLETRRGVISGERDPHLGLRTGWSIASPTPLAANSEGCFDVTLSAQEALYWLFDLGQDHTCQGWVEVADAQGGETLCVSYQEKIRNGELVISDPSTYCRVRITDRFRLAVGEQVVESFALRGGRYLLFQLIGPAESLGLRFHVRLAAYPLAVTRVLKSDDPELNEIAALCERTFHACLQETFVDAVWRESSQWLGDALPQALILASMSDDLRPLRTVIEMAAQGAYPDGVLPGVMPGEVHAYTVVDYNFTWIELLKLYYELAGDDDFVAQMWPVLVKMLDRFHLDVAADGLIRSQPGRRLFLDWAPLSRHDPSALYNFRYLWGMKTVKVLAEAWSGADEGFIEAMMRRCDEAMRAIREAFWREGRWWDNLEQSTFSQLGASFAVLTGAAQPGEIDALLDTVVARSLDADDNPSPGHMVLASPFMHHYLFEALHKTGRSDQILQIIRLRWGRWVRNGDPTCWENWNVDFPDGSQCHAFSAHPRYHLVRILGSVDG